MKESDTDKMERVIKAGLEAMALEMGLDGMPEVLRGANPEIFNCFTMEVCTFLVFYSSEYEKSDSGLCFMEVYSKWVELTGSSLTRKPVDHVIRKYFNRYILCNEKARHRFIDRSERILIGQRAAFHRLKTKTSKNRQNGSTKGKQVCNR